MISWALPEDWLLQAWGWMEWKEGNLSAARALYQRALSINSTTESAARCLQVYIKVVIDS